MQKNYVLRNARSGTGLLPPNPKQWENEHNGLDVRHELSLALNSQLSHEDTFRLLPDVYVVPHTALDIPKEIADRFRGPKSGRWSGMCVPCPSGETLVLYNDSHPIRRIRATLMEEFFHLWLGHPTTRLRILSNYSAVREFDAVKESEAYGSGAAALVPYKPLREMLQAKHPTHKIADHFNVSKQLVEFRAKVTKLSRLLVAA